MKSGFLNRSMALTKMAFQLGMRELGREDAGKRIDQARLLTENLSQLKGAAMKFGQLLSIEAGDYFPPEAQAILAQLQDSATSLPIETIRELLRSELGEERYGQIESLSKTPAASASIAQIHSAIYKGSPVAVKVQHPGVADSIDSDLAILRNLAAAFCNLTQRQMNLDSFFGELKQIFSQEVDFRKEAGFLQQFHDKVPQLNNSLGVEREAFIVPHPFMEMVTEKILVMSWESGRSLTKWIESKPRQQERDEVAKMILNLYNHEFYKWGLVQTDPNFSNFLIRVTDGQPQIVLLDFGATREYSQEFINEYVLFLKAIHNGRPREIIDRAIGFGLLDSREDKATYDLFVDMLSLSVEPFRESSEKGYFNFSDREYARRSREVVKAFTQALKYSPPPYQIIFLHRKLGGIFSMLQRLEAQIDVRPYWDEIVSLKI